jgi:hypothetical protein
LICGIGLSGGVARRAVLVIFMRADAVVLGARIGAVDRADGGARQRAAAQRHGQHQGVGAELGRRGHVVTS